MILLCIIKSGIGNIKFVIIEAVKKSLFSAALYFCGEISGRLKIPDEVG